MRFLGKTGVILENEQNSEEMFVRWSIRNFFMLSGKGGDYYDSPDFDFNNASWCLSMNSNGETQYPPSGCVDFLLKRKDKSPPMTIHLTLCITGVEGVGKREEGKFRFSRHRSRYGWFPFLSRDVLWDHQDILMPYSVLTVECFMKSVAPNPARGVSSYQDKSSQTDGEFQESSVCTGGSQSLNKQDASIKTDEELREAKALSHPSRKQGCENVVEDIAKLLASGEDSDVTVQVGDVEFKVHRAILSARCPVLSAMFRHETEERASNRISISDCEPEIFQQYLYFIYTGSLECLSEQTVFGLYRVADKYLADDLKQQCLQNIQNTLSVQTFCEAMKLALTHEESGLLQVAIDFATQNLPLIICTVEWQNFSCEYPKEANEILVKCICPKN